MTLIESMEEKAGAFTAKFQKYGIANKLEKRSLLIAVNVVASLSIFFFGYGRWNNTIPSNAMLTLPADQGVMAGVNTTRDYAQVMGFGHWDEAQGLVVPDKPLLQGGIVSKDMLPWI